MAVGLPVAVGIAVGEALGAAVTEMEGFDCSVETGGCVDAIVGSSEAVSGDAVWAVPHAIVIAG